MDCGCKVNRAHNPINKNTDIEFCLLHQAAEQMLEALKDFLGCMAQWGDWDDGCFYYSRKSCPELQEPILKAEAVIAIAAAEPKKE